MKPILFLFCIFFAYNPNLLKAQMQDATWYAGQSWYGTPTLSFYQLDRVPEYQRADSIYLSHNRLIRDGRSKATISDPNGNLLFYHDGHDLFNRLHQPMTNGDSIFQMTGGLEEWYESPTGAGLEVSIILPKPDNDSIYFNLYLNMTIDDTQPGLVIEAYGISYSIINIKEDNGLGKVMDKNVLLDDHPFMFGFLKAIRHANGRDWWIPLKERFTPSWKVFLLSPEGLHFHHRQEIFDFENFYARSATYNYAADQMIYLTGVHYYPWQGGHGSDRWFDHQLHFFDFDRCTGLFNFNQTIEINTYKYTIYRGEIGVSSNGKWMYFSTRDHLERIKVYNNDDFGKRDTVLLAQDLDYSTGFYHFKFTPYQELWMVNYLSPFITIVKDPDLSDPIYNSDPETMESVSSNQGFFPNNANYRIGPIDGSPCDTLGINNEPKAWFRYNGLNLENKERRFTDISYFRPEEWHWDFGDGTTFDGQHPGVHEFPAPGEYYVCLTVSNEYAEDTYCEWVVIDEISSTQDLAEDSDFWVFPNPTTGDFTLRLEEAVTMATEVRVYDLLGRELHRHAIPAGRSETQLSLGKLPGGKYILQLFDGVRVRTGSVFLIDN